MTSSRTGQQTDRTILVTGGAGFIGSNFVRHLYNRYPRYRIIVVDALSREIVE